MSRGYPDAAHRVLVIDDHPVVVEGIGSLLAAENDITIVGRAHDAATGLRVAGELRPDVVILDLRLGDGSSPDNCRELLKVAPGTKVLMHTAFDDFEPLRACLRWGAAGAVFKDGHHLVDALRAVLAGGTYVDPRFHEAARQRPSVAGEPAFEALSPREYDLLCAFSLGRSTREIAETLHLTDNTVRGYTKSLLAKLRSSSRIQAVATARRLRLIP